MKSVISIDPSILVGYYDSKAGILESSSSSSSSSTTTSSGSLTTAAPTPPWDIGVAATETSALAKLALSGQNVINPNTALTDVQGAGTQYNSLFTLYQGLNALSGLTSTMLSTTSSAQTVKQAANAFQTGLGQVMSYVNGLNLPNIRVTNGSISSTDSTTNAPATEHDSYTTGVIFQGGMDDEVPAFQGDVQFNINIAKPSGTQISVPIDLSEMGTTARTMPNVVSFINSQLQAAGVTTRFATDMQQATAQTIKVGGQTVTLPAGPDSWSFKITGDSEEQVSFSAPSTAAAVYVAQTSGNPAAGTTSTTSTSSSSSAANDATPIQQLVKLQASDSTTSTAPPAAEAQPGLTGASSDEALATTLQVAKVGATATGPDGSVYVVANVTGSIDGQTLQGTQDVALLKYDSAGELQSATTIGASGSASGYSIAVGADGSVAVAGSVNGSVSPTASTNSATASTTQGFVSFFNSSGQLQWTQQNSGLGNNQANGVAIGANDTVYVVGQTQGALPGANQVGMQDGYLQGYSSTGTNIFTTQFGSSGVNSATSVAVDGSNIVVGGTESGNAVLRSFTANTTGAPTAGTVRNLGSGTISGVGIDNGQVVVAGTTSNGSLSAGTVTAAYTGGREAFAAQLNENLTASSTDAIAYYGGGSGTATTATALSVANGQVYIAGTSTGGLSGLSGPTDITNGGTGTNEGYVANIDIGTGQVQWSQALQGQDGYDAPESIAVDSTGASVLDRLGLPDGTLQYTSSQNLTEATSVRAGDQFQVRTSANGPLATVTISADDTPQSLALKIRQATGYQATVTVVPSGGKEEIQIKPENSQQTIELLPGPAGKDALAPLGLTAGVVMSGSALPTQTQSKTNAAAINPNAKPKIATDTYGLGLDQTFNLTTKAGIQAAQAAISSAMAKVENAYYNYKSALNPTKASSTSSSGTVPQYLTQQIASYQSALARLTGSSSTSSSSSVSYTSAGVAAQLLA